MFFDVLAAAATLALQSNKSRQTRMEYSKISKRSSDHDKAIMVFAENHCFDGGRNDSERMYKEDEWQKYVTDGKHYEEICQEFAPQFEHIYGEKLEE